MSIEQQNRLIAEFDGWIPEYGGAGSSWYSKESTFVPAICLPEHMKYHTSWDWLMPVVEKIGSLACVKEVSVSTVHTRIWLMASFIQAKRNSGDTMLDQCYRTVVEFIQWLNQQNTKA